MIDCMYLNDYTPKSRKPKKAKAEVVVLTSKLEENNTIQAAAETETNGATPAVEHPSGDLASNNTPLSAESLIASARNKKSKPVKKGKKKRLETGHLSTHARLYAMASKYDIPPLKTLATNKLSSEARQEWDSGDFARAIVVAFGSTSDTDRGLRDTITSVILEHASAMSSDELIAAAISSIEGLAFELFKQQSKRPPVPAAFGAQTTSAFGFG